MLHQLSGLIYQIQVILLAILDHLLEFPGKIDIVSVDFLNTLVPLILLVESAGNVHS